VILEKLNSGLESEMLYLAKSKTIYHILPGDEAGHSLCGLVEVRQFDVDRFRRGQSSLNVLSNEPPQDHNLCWHCEKRIGEVGLSIPDDDNGKRPFIHTRQA
jgi:hypothetical protein